MSRCRRCGVPIEPPVALADSICAPFTEVLGPCCPPGRALCLECVELHMREIAIALDAQMTLMEMSADATDGGHSDNAAADGEAEVQTTAEPYDRPMPHPGEPA